MNTQQQSSSGAALVALLKQTVTFNRNERRKKLTSLNVLQRLFGR
jgi:hypothetical protein